MAHDFRRHPPLTMHEGVGRLEVKEEWKAGERRRAAGGGTRALTEKAGGRGVGVGAR